MKTQKTERGQALILLAAGMIGLIGLLALALDGGQGFADRRHAQNAADNAAYAAAYSWIETAKSQGATAATNGTVWRTAGMNIIQQNGYTTDNTTNRNVSITPAPNGVCPENSQGVYITARIDSVVNTWFAPIVGVTKLNNTVSAQSKACLTYTTKLFNGQAVVALGQSGKTMVFDGGTKVIVDGSGLFINSSSACALDRNGGGNGDVIVPGVTIVGGQCSNSKPLTSATAIQQGQLSKQYKDIPGYLSALPDPTKFCTAIQSSSLQGVLDPGIYCVYGNWTGNSDVSGGGVTLVFMDGYVRWTGNGKLNLSAPNGGPFKGIAIYMPYDNEDAEFKMNGTRDYCIRGTILVPSGEVDLRGSSGTLANANCGGYGIVGQVIGEVVGAGGTADVTIQYNANQAGNLAVPPSIELVE